MMNSFEGMNYKQLQFCAKQCGIPANMQRDVLIQALSAYQSHQLALSKQIVENYRENRRKRSCSNGNKPQNLSIKRRGRIMKSVTRNTDEVIADSTSKDIKGNNVVYISSSNGSNSSVYDRDGSNTSERLSLMNNCQPVTQFPVVSSESSRCLLPYDSCINRLDNVNSYGGQSDFSNPCATSTPYSTPLIQPSYSSLYQKPVVFQRIEDHSIYNCCGVSEASHLHTSNFSQNTNLAYDAMNQNYSPLTSTTSLWNPITSRNHSLVQTSHNNNNNNSAQEKEHSLKIDCITCDPPNVSQLDTSVNFNISANISSGPHNSILFCQSDRNEIIENTISDNRDYFTADISSQNPNIQPAAVINDAIMNDELDSSSDANALNLSEDLATFLDWNTPKISPNYCEDVNCAFNSPTDTLYVTQTCSSPSTYGYCPYTAFHNSGIEISNDVSSVQNRSSSYGKTVNDMENFPYQNYTVSALTHTSSEFSATSQDATSVSSIGNVYESLDSSQLIQPPKHQSTCRSNNSFMNRDNATVGTNPATSSIIDEPNSVNLVIPNLSPDKITGQDIRQPISVLESSISSNINHVESHPSDQQSTVCKTPTSIERGPLKSNFAILLRKAFQENKVVKDSTISEKDRSVTDETIDSSIRKEEKKTEMRQLVYESETLHRSKIICSIPSDQPSLKEGNVRKILHSYLTKDSAGSCKPLTFIRKSLVENNESQHQVAMPLCRPCVFQKRGCSITVSASHVHAHERKCTYQPVCCPNDVCCWEDSMNLLIRHIYECHMSEIKKRNDFVYVIDRTLNDNQSIYTFFQMYKEVIYIIRLHLIGGTCIAEVQFLPEIELTSLKKKSVSGTMQLMSFCRRPQVRTWNGTVPPFYEEIQDQQAGTIQVNIHDSTFVALRLHID